jgi:hypothetical protein
VFQQIILGIAFNEPVLYKLWRFLDVYCGNDAQEAFTSALTLFCLAFTRSLWVTSFEEFLKSPLFERKDVVGLVQMLRPLIIDIVLSPNKTVADEFTMHSASVLLRLLHELFAVKDFVDPSAWDIP